MKLKCKKSYGILLISLFLLINTTISPVFSQISNGVITTPLIKGGTQVSNSECPSVTDSCTNFTYYIEHYCNDSINYTNLYTTIEASDEYCQQLLTDSEFEDLYEWANELGYVECGGKWLVHDETIQNTIFIGFRINEDENDSIFIISYEMNEQPRKSFLAGYEEGSDNEILYMLDREGGTRVNLTSNQVIEVWGSHHSCDYWVCVGDCMVAWAIAGCLTACSKACIGGPLACLLCGLICVFGVFVLCLIWCGFDPCSHGHMCVPGTTSGYQFCDTLEGGLYRRHVYQVCSVDGQSWTYVYVQCLSGFYCDPNNPGCIPVAALFPVAEAGVDQFSTEDQIVYFSSLGSNDPDGYIATYYWDFGDSGAYGPNPTYIYSQAGIYTVTLTVTDDDGYTGWDSMTVTVYNIPPVAIVGADQEAIIGDPVQFDGSYSADTPSDLPLLSYYWDFGDGTSGTGAITSHRFNEIGEYTVTLTVTDDDGASGSVTQNVIITPIPAVINVDPDTLNLKSKGKFITAYIEIPDKDLSQIDLSSILLNEIIPAITDPKYGFVSNPTVVDRDGNGVPELMIKIDRASVQDSLSAGEIIPIKITGEIIVTWDGTPHQLPFEGIDTIRVI